MAIPRGWISRYSRIESSLHTTYCTSRDTHFVSRLVPEYSINDMKMMPVFYGVQERNTSIFASYLSEIKPLIDAEPEKQSLKSHLIIVLFIACSRRRSYQWIDWRLISAANSEFSALVFISTGQTKRKKEKKKKKKRRRPQEGLLQGI